MTEKADKSGKSNKKLHSGHRERMREKFLNNGIECFEPHEIIEMCLFYPLPYVNTNEIAHELIDKFGSVHGIINADPRKLTEVKGIGENAASFFSFFREVARYYFKEEIIDFVDVSDKESLTAYCKKIYFGIANEEIKLILLKDDLKVIKDIRISEGTPGKVDIPLRTITKRIMDYNVNMIVLSHNHPQGTCMPSRADVDETYKIWQMLSQLDVTLIDHVIVGSDGEWSMRFNKTLPEIWSIL